MKPAGDVFGIGCVEPHEDTEMDDKSLYDQEVRGMLASVAGAARPDPVVLAAWLDGQLGAADAARVEEWLAGSADARMALAVLREATLESVPEPELARLRALVPSETRVRSRRTDRWHARLAVWFPRPSIALAAIVLVACTAWLGLAAGERLAEAQWQRQAAAALPGGFLLDRGV